MGRWVALTLVAALLGPAPAARAEDEPPSEAAAPAPAAAETPEAADDKADSKDEAAKAETSDEKKPAIFVKSDHRGDGRLPFMSFGRLTPAPDKSRHDVTPLPQRIVTVTGAAVACGDAPAPAARLELTGPAPDGAPAPTRSHELSPDATRRVYVPPAGDAGFEAAQLSIALPPEAPPAEPCIVTLTGRVERDLRPPETTGEAGTGKKDED